MNDQTTAPPRQVRAMFDEDTITVYQAYSAAIAVPAAANGSFSETPFKIERMTWIKPSFLWMMYRSGWATKPGQERILAIRITRSGFEEALSHAVLSHFDPEVHPDHPTWVQLKRVSPVRVQWDPERSITLGPLPWRSLQVGLGGRVVHDYVHRWTVGIDDITPLVRDIHDHVVAGRTESARAAAPVERPYPLPPEIALVTGTSRAT